MAMREIELFRSLDAESTWRCNFFRLRESQRVLAELRPGRIVVEALPTDEWPCSRFWPARKRRRGGGQRRQRRRMQDAPQEGALEDAADEVGDADADADDTGFLVDFASAGEDEALQLSSGASDSSADDASRSNAPDAEVEPRGGSDDDLGQDSDSSGLPPPPANAAAPAAESAAPPSPSPAGLAAGVAGEPLVAAEPGQPPPPPIDLPCWVKCDIAGRGSIVWYRSNGNFVASCSQPHHGGISLCKKTRTSQSSDRRRPQGRPLGHLMSWLLQQGDPGCHDYKSHHAMRPSFQQRREAREALKAIGGGELLFAAERPRREDESSEPEGLA